MGWDTQWQMMVVIAQQHIFLIINNQQTHNGDECSVSIYIYAHTFLFFDKKKKKGKISSWITEISISISQCLYTYIYIIKRVVMIYVLITYNVYICTLNWLHTWLRIIATLSKMKIFIKSIESINHYHHNKWWFSIMIIFSLND